MSCAIPRDLDVRLLVASADRHCLWAIGRKLASRHSQLPRAAPQPRVSEPVEGWSLSDPPQAVAAGVRLALLSRPMALRRAQPADPACPCL